jgi:dipeptidyl aminopeptidase/acylaminoacyl peptidase
MRTNTGMPALVFVSLLAIGPLVAGCGEGSPLGPPASGGSGGATAAGGVTGGAGSTDQAGATGSGGLWAAGGVSGTNGNATDPGGVGAPVRSCAAALVGDGMLDRWIAFDSDRADFRRQIYRMHPDGTNATRLLTDASIDKEPSFSPDGARIAFTSDRAGAPQLFLLDLASKAVTPLTKRPEGADQPSFSHDGKRVAFHSGASVYVIGVDGGGEQLVGMGLDSFNAYFWPHFSLDDGELVFDRNNEIDAIGIVSAAFRQIVQNTTTLMRAPAVSPDGNDVAYQVYCGEPGDSIWTTPFSTTTQACKGRRVTPPGDLASDRPAWGSSSLLAYERIDTKTNVASIALISRQAGSQPCVLTPAGSDNRNPAWSP